MKRISIKFVLLALFLVTFNQSCTNLDEELFDQVAADDFFKTDEEFIAALGAAYTSLYGLMGHNSLMSINEVSSDEIMIPQRGGDWFDGGIWLRVHRHEFNFQDEHTNNAWNFCFGGVNTCNRLIFQFQELVDNGSVPQEDADPFIAELKVLRGLFYYWLLDTWGDVPLVTSFDVPDGFAPSKEDKSKIYEFIEMELTTNVPKLSTSVDQSTYGRMNYYAGQALLAKLYINAERYKGSPEWTKAEAAVDEVLGGPFQLEGNYFTNFDSDNISSKEGILVVPYDKVFATGFVLPAMTLHYSSQNTFNLTFQPWNGYCTLEEFYNSYDDGDVRKGEYGNQQVRGNFHAGPQFESDGLTPIVDGSFDDDGDEEIVFTPAINEHFPNCWREAGARVGKYEFPLGSTPDLSTDYAIFRLADFILMKAELRLRDGDEGMATMYANMVRSRAKVGDYNSLSLDELLAERGRELFYEYWRRQDLIRFGKFGDEWGFKPASDECAQFFPVPKPQLDANSNLTQNPCY